uniref:Receptor-like serine/threonine-protein kinase n=2 Tax=Leavenworthia alabamica TaxID=310722 RepID=A0A2Z4HJM8_LEAAL|nr:S-domain receptor kinase [Leavenworthia alabamica]
MSYEALNKPHSYTFIFLFVLILFLGISISANILSSTESLTISSNKTIVSPGEVFELGFFKLLGDNWYLGIWYKTMIAPRTYVWVANRDNPLSSSIGILKISRANLVLLNQSNIPVWSTNLTAAVRFPVVAELYDTGNFVLRDSKTNDSDGFLWESFDFPTDTLLPQMKLGWDLKRGRNRFLYSWKNPYDPSSGKYEFRLEQLQRIPEFFLWMERHLIVYRAGPWDGLRFSGIPEMQQWDNTIYNFTENREEAAFTFRLTNHDRYSRLILNSDGILQRFTWSNQDGWNMYSSIPKDKCDIYQLCGPYAYCDMNTSPMCNCIEGFVPNNSEKWESGNPSDRCQRKMQLTCGGDNFVQLSNMKLPATTPAILDKRIGLNDCKKRCVRNCSCTAYANADVRNGGWGCLIWIGEFTDIRNYVVGGQDLYVRVSSADIGRRRNISGKVIGLTVGVSVILLVSLIMYCFWKKKHKRAVASIVNQESKRHLFEESKTDDFELPLIEFEALVMATNNFSDSNKLGEGGFGIVYKGKLIDGQEIAVKRLSKMSHQGTNEFKNEVRLIARLQHINLVRLLSWCVYTDEKILIYEYLENRSLDSHIFDKEQSFKLNWQKRFDIINGIARGLLYLHQDSRCKIIHRDLKAGNILLDKDMNPKISDFGMAKIFEKDETEANTRKVVGTYGYMAPEYAMDGKFSVKSDAFSFGVLLLEIVSGKRNRGFYSSNRDTTLLNWTWGNWKEGNGLQIVDPIIIDSSSTLSTFRQQEVLRCIQIGLLCVQEYAEDRPKMSTVVLMLGSKTGEIPLPKPPGFCVARISPETNSSSSTQRAVESLTVNQITLSVIDGR